MVYDTRIRTDVHVRRGGRGERDVRGDTNAERVLSVGQRRETAE
jgi:hypothetical protein